MDSFFHDFHPVSYTHLVEPFERFYALYLREDGKHVYFLNNCLPCLRMWVWRRCLSLIHIYTVVVDAEGRVTHISTGALDADTMYERYKEALGV